MTSHPDGALASLRSPLTWMLLGALALSALVVRPLALELGVGLVLGYVSERPIAWALRRMHRANSPGWRWAVAIAVAVLASMVLLVPATIAVSVSLGELGRLIGASSLDSVGRAPAMLNGWIRHRLGVASDVVPSAELATRGRALVEAVGAWLARTTGRALTAAPDAIFSAVVVMTAWVTFAVRGPAMRDAVLPRLIPWRRERDILRRTTAEVIDGVVLANVGVSVVQAGIITASTLALRIPHAVVWGVASFVLSFIPLVGTALVTVTAALFLLAQGRTVAALIMAVIAVVAGSIDNVLRPMLARTSSELPFVWMMVAFVGGLTAFGPAGVVLGPLVLAWSVALWNAHEADEAATVPPPS
jgi:predicted PurR-regulated permease PerM